MKMSQLTVNDFYFGHMSRGTKLIMLTQCHIFITFRLRNGRSSRPTNVKHLVKSHDPRNTVCQRVTWLRKLLQIVPNALLLQNSFGKPADQTETANKITLFKILRIEINLWIFAKILAIMLDGWNNNNNTVRTESNWLTTTILLTESKADKL